MKIIFLNIDGVLNGYGLFIGSIQRIADKFNLTKISNKLNTQFKVKKKYAKLLSKIVQKSGAKVVVTSSWRGEWMLSNNLSNWDSVESFKKWMKYYNIEVIDITPKIDTTECDRSIEICKWLEDHNNEIDSYCIIDSEYHEFIHRFHDRLVCTSNMRLKERDYGYNIIYENTGLKRHHIKEVLNVLNYKCIERKK